MFSLKKFIKYIFILLFFSVLLSFSILFDNKILDNSLTDIQKLNWLESKMIDDQNFELNGYEVQRKRKVCKEEGFRIDLKTGKNIICENNYVFTFTNNKEKLTFSEKIEENYLFIIFSFIFLFIYLKSLNPRIFKKAKTNISINYPHELLEKIKEYKIIEEENLNQLEDYGDLILKDISKYNQLKKELNVLEIQASHLGMKDVSIAIKVISEKIKGAYYFKRGQYLKWLSNLFAYTTSVYLTSMPIFFGFLILFVYFNAFLFREIFYITSNGTFLKSSFWYVYETINITSNLGGNTEAHGIIQQSFLSYLTVSGIIIFGLFLTIISEKMKTN